MRGRYASVERILELPGDRVEWRMATTSSAGGLIPQFFANLAMPEVVSKVIPNIPIHRFITDDISTRQGCAFIFEVDGREESVGWGRDINRVGPIYLDLIWLVWLFHRQGNTTEVPRPNTNYAYLPHGHVGNSETRGGPGSDRQNTRHL